MKKLLKILSIIILMTFAVDVFASASQFDVFLNVPDKIDDNKINVALGYYGEEVMALTQKLSYDSSKLKLVDIVSLDDFNLTRGKDSEDGKWKTITFLSDSDYSFKEVSYAVFVFEPTSSFKSNSTADIFFYDVIAGGSKKTKYRSNGKLLSVRRKKNNELTYITENIDKSVKTRYWFLDHLFIFGLIGAVIIMFFAMLLLIPSKHKKESREKKLANEINNEKIDTSVPFKLDQSLIDEIGEEKKEIDMSEAIIVDENINPFGGMQAGDNSYVNVTNNQAPSDTINNETPENDDLEILELPDEEENKTTPINNDPSNLTSINPKTFEKAENVDINSTDRLLNILIFLAISVVSVSVVFANEYDVDSLRNCLIGNNKCENNLDYNNDKKIDILDLIETKNTEDCNFEELSTRDENFKELHDRSGVYKKYNISGKRTTVKKSSGGSKNSGSGNKTTKSRSKEPSTTNTNPYNITIQAVNGSVSGPSTIVVKGNENKAVTVKPNSGYSYLDADCGGGASVTYNYSAQELHISRPSRDTTCTVKFDMNVYNIYIVPDNGVTEKTPVSVKAGENATVKVTPKEGYEYYNHSCTKGLESSYDRGTNILTIKNANDSSRCDVIFTQKKQKVLVHMGSSTSDYNITYGQSTSNYTFKSNLEYSSVTCDGKNITLNKSRDGDYFVYTFDYIVKKDVECKFN